MDQSPSPPDKNMAALVAPQLAVPGVAKRYRPSPAKTFQCRGYGDCRMVFSRSEHLARHIRKHTGERPFACHCAKQFSRLDNLRQHAQTVHADKQDDNERMMRDLTSLHATMTAANKLGVVRPGRKTNASSTTNGGNSALASSAAPLILIKQEDVAHQRPDTSTGYESGEAMYQPTNSSFRDQSHSFRDSTQSFLAPPTSRPPPSVNSQSFLGYPGSQIQLTDAGDGTRPPSRPTTSSGLANPQHPRSLPPLAAVVSAALPSPQSPPSAGPHSSASQQHQQHQRQSFLPFPSSFGHHRRSSTHRPGTAPAAASLFARAAFPDRARLGSTSGRPDLSLLHSGFGGRSFGFVDHLHQQFNLGDSADISTSPGNDASPFYFNPPVPANSSPAPVNPRKRPFGGPDGPSDDSNQLRDRPTSSAGPFGELHYEYGSESRPQSRRLTVMELCNDDDADPRPPSQRRDSALLLSTAPNATGGSSSRPTTSSGLVSSTSTLRLFDRATSPGATQPTTVFSRTTYAAASPVGDGASGGRGPPEGERGGSGALATSYSRIPSVPSASTTFSNTTPSPPTPSPAILSPSDSAADAFSNVRQQQQYQHYSKQSHNSITHSPSAFSATSGTSNGSCSPRSPLSDSSGGSPFASYANPSTRSAVYAGGSRFSPANAHSGSGISTQSHHLHHHQQRDAHQVRASVSPHPASFGMRV